MASQTNKIIFILGHGRSGTTLLNKVLTAHPQIHFINWEFDDLVVFYQRQSYYDRYGVKKYEVMAKDFFRHPWINLLSFPYNLIDWSQVKDFHGWLDLIFNYYRQKTGKSIIGVKIANNLHRVKNTIANMRMIQTVLPDAYCLQIVRDPCDIFLSFRKIRVLPWFLSPYYFGWFWAKAVTNIASLQQTNKYYQLKYEDLISQPEQEINKICDFLGIPFDAMMLKFYLNPEEVRLSQANLKKDFISANFNKWPKELRPETVKLISQAAGQAMLDFGYLGNDRYDEIKFTQKIREKIKMAFYFLINYFIPWVVRLKIKFKIDYFFGLCGLILKKYSPSFYWFLKRRALKNID